MYFPDKKNKRFTAAILITSILAILCLRDRKSVV